MTSISRRTPGRIGRNALMIRPMEGELSFHHIFALEAGGAENAPRMGLRP